MKKILVLSMLTCFTIICSCQKQDSAAEQELAQRKTELDGREKALDEKVTALDEKVAALDEKVTALVQKEQATLNARTTATDVQSQTPDPAQVQAERERTIQQFSAEMRAMVPDDSKMKSDLEKQRGLEELQRQSSRKSKMFSGAVFPAPAPTSPTLQATSPTPSSAVEEASPTSSPESQ
jgi:DNA repair exonuclease SbcCD ATPase subunit